MINAKEQDKGLWSKILQQISFRIIFLSLFAFFIGRIELFGGYFTFVVAYIGAMYFDDNLRKWSAFLGVMGILSLGNISTLSVKYILIIVCIVGGQAGIKLLGLKSNEKVQSILVCTSILILSIVYTMLTQFTPLGIITTVLESCVGGGLVIIISYSIKIIRADKITPLTEAEMASLGILIAGLLGGMIDFSVRLPISGDVYFKDVIIFILMISTIVLGGMSSGIILTLVISTVLIILGYMPTGFIAIYLFAALIGGLFCFLDRIGIIFASGLGMIIGFALFNEKIIDTNIMGAYVVAGIISLVIPRNYFGIGYWFGYESELNDEKHLGHIQTIITDRLLSFSKSLSELGRMFDKISDKDVYITQSQVNNIIEDTGECVCHNCAMQNFCWNDYLKDTYKHSYDIINTIEKKGTVLVGDIPEKFKSSCVQSENFAFTLGLKLDLLKADIKWKKKFAGTRGLIAQQFDAVSESIYGLTNNISKEIYFNKEDEHAIRQKLNKVGIRTNDVMVLESDGRKQEIHLYVKYNRADGLKDKIVEAVSIALETKVEIIKYNYDADNKCAYFKLAIKKKFRITTSVAVSSRKAEACGDEYSFMEVANGKYLLALADGMGSGEVANRESKATIQLLESLMEAGFSNEIAVKMINSVLVLKSEVENFSTMDITLIDEHTGMAEFIKLGASTSFVLRNGEIMTIKSSSLPVGILNKVDSSNYKKQLMDGDIIIMVTDGILESRVQYGDREETFKYIVQQAKSNNPKYLAEYLLEKSKNLLSNEDKDDMSIIVARVWKQVV